MCKHYKISKFKLEFLNLDINIEKSYLTVHTNNYVRNRKIYFHQIFQQVIITKRERMQLSWVQQKLLKELEAWKYK